jgi:hypothetical protein
MSAATITEIHLPENNCLFQEINFETIQEIEVISLYAVKGYSPDFTYSYSYLHNIK